MITGLAHAAINVADMERSLHFYRDILGFPVVQDHTLETGVRLLHVRVSEQATVELFERPEPLAAIPSMPHVGLVHLALAVDNVDRIYAELRAKGVEFTGEPRFGRGQTSKIVFCKDPDGTLVEFVEFLEK